MLQDNPQFGKRSEQFSAPEIIFWGEQDGPPERELKSHLAELFGAEQAVTKAYLARVTYSGSSTESVALCLRPGAAPSKRVIGRVGEVFSSMFGRHEHLDIMFLTDAQEAQLAKVCKPFFVQ